MSAFDQEALDRASWELQRHFGREGSIYGIKACEEIARIALVAYGVPEARRIVPIKVRPMLVSGQLATDPRGPMILIDSEQDPKEQVAALWHETLHLLGMTDEFLVEEYAMSLADACPRILFDLAPVLNVPDSLPSPLVAFPRHPRCKDICQNPSHGDVACSKFCDMLPG